VTIFDDGSADLLTGNDARDWFFALLAEVTDKAANEEVDT
jgi:hypothetical protein